MRRIISGLIIGGAIGSVIGRALVDKHDREINGNSGKKTPKKEGDS